MNGVAGLILSWPYKQANVFVVRQASVKAVPFTNEIRLVAHIIHLTMVQYLIEVTGPLYNIMVQYLSLQQYSTLRRQPWEEAEAQRSQLTLLLEELW